MSDSIVTQWPTRLLSPWYFPGKNTGIGCHFLLQGIVPSHRSNLHLLPWQAGSLTLSHWGNPVLILHAYKKILSWHLLLDFPNTQDKVLTEPTSHRLHWHYCHLMGVKPHNSDEDLNLLSFNWSYRSQDLMKLRLLMSHHRNNSVKEKW